MDPQGEQLWNRSNWKYMYINKFSSETGQIESKSICLGQYFLSQSIMFLELGWTS